MHRRNFLKAFSSGALLAAAETAPRQKITDVRIVPLKLLRDVGMMEAAWNPGTRTMQRIGGGSYLEIHTDHGLVGIGPGMESTALEAGKQQLLGKDPVRYRAVGGPAPILSERKQPGRRRPRNRAVGSHRQIGAAAGL